MEDDLRNLAMEFMMCRRDLNKAGELLIINPDMLTALKRIVEAIKEPFTELSDPACYVLYVLRKFKEKYGSASEFTKLEELTTLVAEGGKLNTSSTGPNKFINLDENDQQLIKRAVEMDLRETNAIIVDLRTKSRVLTKKLGQLESVYSEWISDLS